MWSAVKRSRTSWRPCSPRRRRRSASASRRRIATASARGSSAGTSRPVSPSRTASRDAADVRRDHGRAGQQRLEQGEREALEAGGEREDVEGAEVGACVVGPALPDHAVRNSDALGEFFEPRPLAPFADEDERHVFDVGERADQDVEALLPLEPADRADERTGPRAIGCVMTLVGDPVVDRRAPNLPGARRGSRPRATFALRRRRAGRRRGRSAVSRATGPC